jgi:hypothetical protein
VQREGDRWWWGGEGKVGAPKRAERRGREGERRKERGQQRVCVRACVPATGWIGGGGCMEPSVNTLFNTSGVARYKKTSHDCDTMMRVRASVSPASEPPLLPESIPFYQGCIRTFSLVANKE